VTLEFTVLEFTGILPAINADRGDIVCSAARITAERARAFDFSIPYSRDALIALVPASNNEITGPTDLKGRVVGALLGPASGDVVRGIGGFKDLRIYPGTTELFADYLAGRLDMAVVGDIESGGFIEAHPGVAKIVGKPYRVSYAGAAMKLGSTALKAELDAAITAARQDGTLNALAEKYFHIPNFTDSLPPIGQPVKFD
jgi:ABC-type amino acid transport substrate-binding protein